MQDEESLESCEHPRDNSGVQVGKGNVSTLLQATLAPIEGGHLLVPGRPTTLDSK